MVRINASFNNDGYAFVYRDNRENMLIFGWKFQAGVILADKDDDPLVHHRRCRKELVEQ